MKRIFAVLLTLGVLFTCCYGTAFAMDYYDARASYTLSGYSAELYSDSHKGEVYINYNVHASKLADSVGVESITFYKANGAYVNTVYGSVSNGLVGTKTSMHGGDYYPSLTSGVSYYAEVTVYATVGDLYDSRTITTSTVKVP